MNTLSLLIAFVCRQCVLLAMRRSAGLTNSYSLQTMHLSVLAKTDVS